MEFRRRVHRRGKRLIVCLTADPDGAAALAAALGASPDVAVVHEPESSADAPRALVSVARRSRVEPQDVRAWWKDQLAWIEALPAPVAALTSHLFAAGPGDVLLDMRRRAPDAVWVASPPRDAAIAMWRRGWIPGESLGGRMYALHPDNPRHRALPGWMGMTAYQLCYWYAVEMGARVAALVGRVERAGGAVVTVEPDVLRERGGVLRLLGSLGLAPPERFQEPLPAPPGPLPPGDPEAQEREVLAALAASAEVPAGGPTKVDLAVLASRAIDPDLLGVLCAATHDGRWDVTCRPSWAKPTSSNRNGIAREFRLSERRAEWLGMVDHDSVPPLGFLEATEADADVVLFPTPMHVPSKSPADPILWNVQAAAGRERFASGAEMARLDGPFPEVASGGMGAVLVRRRVLEHPKMRWPFRDVFDEDGVRTKGHDLDFCERAGALGFKVCAAMRFPCEHYKTVGLKDLRALLNRREGERDRALQAGRQAAEQAEASDEAS